ncbi:hypothetical protein ACOMHN_004962 [Nucella lapillus]
MNGTTLAHHTKLIEWCNQKQRHGNSKRTDPLPKTQKSSQLSPDKYDSIGKWCTEVNRLFIKPPEAEPPQLFRKCKYSDYMFPPNKSTSKTRAVNLPATLWTRPGKASGVKSAVLTGQAVVKPQTADRYVADEKKTVLAAKMADTNDHYVHERKTVHLHIQPEFKRKLSTGWTINRPMLYPKVPPPPPPENLLVDIPAYLMKNEENVMEVCQDGSSQSKGSTPNAEKFDVPKIVTSKCYTEKNGVPKIVSISEADGHDSHEDFDESGGDFKTKGTQCVPPDADLHEADPPGKEVGEDLLTPKSRNKPVISDRSTSNSILNVLSVDDCKMVMRYRPMRVIDTQESMILPPSKPPLPKNLEESDGDEEDRDDHAPSSTQHTPIRLSQGSNRTTLTPSQVNSRVHAYREMYNTYSKRTPEAKVLRPSSAAVEKAFDVLLDKEFQACQSSRRPLSCPSKANRHCRPSSRASDHSSVMSTPSTKFRQLNTTLRQQMYDLLDSRWHSTKMKFHRTKNGYSKSDMKKARMVTSSPKELWGSDEELMD